MTLVETLFVAGVSAGSSTYVAVQLLALRVKSVEETARRLAKAVEGEDGLNVRVAVLEREAHARHV